MINIPKGTKDVLPDEVYKWQYVESIAKETAKRYGFREIRTPVFEHTELFRRGVGETTDVVGKEMYTFLDKGGRSLTLRPEGTAGVARAFLESGLQGGAMPFKSYYLISAFRYERPQAGRLREFHQFGAELYGAASPFADAETIAFADSFLKNIGLRQYTLKLNSIGCPLCRARFVEALKAYLSPHLGEMCEDCRERFEKNPLRILDCKVETCKKIVFGAPKITDYLCEECSEHYRAVKSNLSALSVPFEEDPLIVRGLDYYSRTVFEFTSKAAGAQGTLLGGGRYDTLLEQMDAKPTPAVGFAAGIERLLMVLEAENVSISKEDKTDCYFAGLDPLSRQEAFRLSEALRREGISCECDLMDRSLKAQLKFADKIGAKFVAIIGEEEEREKAAQVKDMKNSTTEKVPFDALFAYLKEKMR